MGKVLELTRDSKIFCLVTKDRKGQMPNYFTLWKALCDLKLRLMRLIWQFPRNVTEVCLTGEPYSSKTHTSTSSFAVTILEGDIGVLFLKDHAKDCMCRYKHEVVQTFRDGMVLRWEQNNGAPN